MKVVRAARILLLVLASAGALAQSDAQKALDQLKRLDGTWQGKDAKGGPVQDTYRLTAGGTAVMGENKMGAEDMLSLFYVDGERLLMTHFCPSGNQPRMQATISSDGKSISFDFLDVTNLASPQAGHMHHAVYLFSDADHYTEQWTWRQDGKDTTFQYEMQRKK
jgi:hypothetical protein